MIFDLCKYTTNRLYNKSVVFINLLNSKAKKIKKQNIQKTFGKHLKKLRQSKGLTQLDLSCRINKDQQSLQRVESGNVNPSLFYLLELAEGLNIKLPELLDFNY